MGGWVYIVASRRNGTIYIGVTNDLWRRTQEHREGDVAGFTRKYGCKTLVWYERHDDIRGAIQREKSLKRYVRAWKLRLIESFNPEWDDLFTSCYERDNPFIPVFVKKHESEVPKLNSAGLDPRAGARG